MTGLPPSDDALVLRTDFTDDEAWSRVRELIQRPDPDDGFVAYVECVSDPGFDGVTPAALTELAGRDPEGHSYLFVVDAVAMHDPSHPVLVLDLCHDPGRTFRVVPAHMWSVENNLSISNMDFLEFADAVDADGVFRGFRDSQAAPTFLPRRREGWWRGPRVQASAQLVGCLLLVAGSLVGITEGGLGQIVVGGCGLAFFGFGAVMAAFNLRLERPPRGSGPEVLPDEVRRHSWFEDDEDDEDDTATGFPDDAWLEALRERARSWPAGGVESSVIRHGDVVMAVISLIDGAHSVADFGVQRIGSVVRGGRLDRGFALRDGRTPFERTGPVDEVLQPTVDWLERLIRRPVHRLEWWHKGRRYAVRYVFADTGSSLLEGVAPGLAPRKPRSGGDRPDTTVVVRQDGRATSSSYPGIGFSWRRR